MHSRLIHKTFHRALHICLVSRDLLTWCVIVLFSCSAWAQEATQDLESRVKAVFLFHFAQFVEWPPAAVADPAAPFVIGVLGPDPFGTFLDDTVRGETIDGHQIVVRRYASVAELRPAHILFVNGSELSQLERILDAARKDHTLTVSDAPEFPMRGGTIRFETVGGKVRFRINTEAAEAAGLTISSKLLRRATIVRSGH